MSPKRDLLGDRLAGIKAQNQAKEEALSKQPPADPSLITDAAGEAPIEPTPALLLSPVAIPPTHPSIKSAAGKSANDEWSKSTIYLHNVRKQEVQRRLIGDPRDLSDLIDELLDAWLDG